MKHDTKLKVAFIGYGKVARSLLMTMKHTPLIQVTSIFSRKESKRDTALHCAHTSFHHTMNTFYEEVCKSHTDLVFLAVPDSSIREVAKEFLSLGPSKAVLVHLCGAFGVEHFAELSKSHQFGAFHPLFSCRKGQALKENTVVAIEGTDEESQQKLHQLAEFLHLRPAFVPHAQKATYHLAATLTGSLSYGLVQHSLVLLQECGFSEHDARLGLSVLLSSVAHNLKHGPISEVATGPAMRGDFQTIEKHLGLTSAGAVRTVYQALSETLMNLSKEPQNRNEPLAKIPILNSDRI